MSCFQINVSIISNYIIAVTNYTNSNFTLVQFNIRKLNHVLLVFTFNSLLKTKTVSTILRLHMECRKAGSKYELIDQL